MMPTRKYYNQNWLPSIFNDFFDNNWMEKANATAPAINVVESDKDYKVEVAVPGMTKEDFNIHLGDETNWSSPWKRKLKRRTKKTKNTYDVSSLTPSSNSHFTCPTMSIKKRLLPM